METTIKKLPKSQIELKIEVPVDEFNQFIEKAVLDLGKNIEVKGFRKGKVPKEIVEKEIGLEKILVEAANLAVEENYKKAVLENKFEVVSQPKIEIQKLAQGNPLIFLVKISILPEIKLPDYKKDAAKIKKREVSVEEKEIADALKWLRKSRAKFTLKNGPAQKGDFIEIEYWSSELEGSLNPKGQKDAFILGEGHFVPGFEEKLIGMRIGEEKEGIPVTIPENHRIKNLAGKKLTFKVKIKSVQKAEFPEIGDQFAKSLGKFEDLNALKKNIKEGLTIEKQQAESQRVRNEILEKIAQTTECEIPEILAEQEKKRMLGNFKREVSEKLKTSFADYLTKIKKTEKEILDSFSSQAQKKVKNFLILREIGKREKIEVSAEEITEGTNKILKQYSAAEGAQKNLGLDPERLKEYTKEVIKNEKIFQLLENL